MCGVDGDGYLQTDLFLNLLCLLVGDGTECRSSVILQFLKTGDDTAFEMRLGDVEYGRCRFLKSFREKTSN